MAGYSGASFRPQLPIAPVVYPPYCGRGCTARYFMQSKILAVAAIFLGLAFVIAFACAFLPFWFILKFNILDSTFGTEGTRKIVANAGIFFYDEKEYVSLILLEKSTNRVVIPPVTKVAQVMEMISLCGVFCTFAGATILAFRKYSSVTGVMFLAALAVISALGQILMVIFSILTIVLSNNAVCESGDNACTYRDNLVWRNLPFFQDYVRFNQHTTPQIEANWSFYIAIIGAALSVASAVLLWIEGLKVCNTIGDIRYRQLREKRNVLDDEKEPTDFIFSPPARAVTTSYSVKPAYASAARPTFQKAPQAIYRPPPSVSGASSQSESYGPREINL